MMLPSFTKRNSAHVTNEDDSLVDEAMSLFLHDDTSPVTTDSVRDSSLSDDLRDLDIIPIDLKTDPGNANLVKTSERKRVFAYSGSL